VKARICECCKKTINETTPTEMAYIIEICESEGFVADTAAEKKLLLSLDDVCSACTAKVKAAIQFILKGAKEK
jgi:hypothetical protein